MEHEHDCAECRKHHWGRRNAGGGGAVYGIGLFGALWYYLQTAGSFGAGVYGIVKAIVWPGVLVYEALKHLHM